LDAAYRRTADNLSTNEAVHIDRAHGRHELVLSGLDKLDEPPSLIGLRTLVAQRVPRVELPELLLEVQAWTGFASDFTHVNEHGARADDLPISVCAVLLVEACNVGLGPLVRPEIPALTRARLAWIQQSYIRADTITTANNRLVDVHAALPMTKALGGGELASADGIRFDTRSEPSCSSRRLSDGLASGAGLLAAPVQLSGSGSSFVQRVGRASAIGRMK
jgi:hypothetical protein